MYKEPLPQNAVSRLMLGLTPSMLRKGPGIAQQVRSNVQQERCTDRMTCCHAYARDKPYLDTPRTGILIQPQRVPRTLQPSGTVVALPYLLQHPPRHHREGCHSSSCRHFHYCGDRGTTAQRYEGRCSPSTSLDFCTDSCRGPMKSPATDPTLSQRCGIQPTPLSSPDTHRHPREREKGHTHVDTQNTSSFNLLTIIRTETQRTFSTHNTAGARADAPQSCF